MKKMRPDGKILPITAVRFSVKPFDKRLQKTIFWSEIFLRILDIEIIQKAAGFTFPIPIGPLSPIPQIQKIKHR